MPLIPVEIVELEPGEALGPDERKVRVTGRTVLDRDGNQVTFVQYNTVQFSSLVFMDGQWQADSENLKYTQYNSVKIDWSALGRLAATIDASFTVENEQPALPSKS